MRATESPRTGIDRRELLKKAAITGGAALWATPVVQVVTMKAAHAAVPSRFGGIPSHGFALVDCGRAVNGITTFYVKVDHGTPGVIDKEPGAGNDKPYLEDQQGQVYGVDYRAAENADLVGFTSGVTPGNDALFITMPAGCAFVDGFVYVFDGSFQGGGDNCGDADKFTNAFVDGQTVYFSTTCNDTPSGGELPNDP